MKRNIYQKRRTVSIFAVILGLVLTFLASSPESRQQFVKIWQDFAYYDLDLGAEAFQADEITLELLENLEVKGRAPKTGYSRDSFSNGWATQGACTMRNLILKRDMSEVKMGDNCRVLSGQLYDNYSGKTIEFTYGPATSREVQIDHIVAVSDAWQKGAQSWEADKRRNFYNDPENLVAVSGELNQEKSDQDAASWLPPNKAFRCQYVARQIHIKAKYDLWVTSAEKSAMQEVLKRCAIEKE